ncbi:uncharacterized protein GLRG_05556, partial [Colletotrichum graminicola M1.001]
TPNQNQIHYSINLLTNPDPRWPGESGFIGLDKVKVIYRNINAASDFIGLHTGTNNHVHHALIQVARHLARSLYCVVSLSITEDSCMVFVLTKKPKCDLMWKNGFPWHIEEDAQPEVGPK